MDFDPARLRRGEIVVGAGAVVLLASMFFLKWYGLSTIAGPTAANPSVSGSLNGWDALLHLRWLILVTIACGLGLVFAQTTRRAPALPVSMSVIVTVLGVPTALALAYRVLINTPGPDSLLQPKAGAFVGLLGAIALSGGGYLSMRQEGVAPRDGPSEVPTVRLGES